MIVKNITKRCDIPHEQGEWMVFRRLSWKQLEEASDISSDASFERIKKMGPEIMAAFTKDIKAQESGAAYDRTTVLHKGIVKWSYEDEVNSANIDALDETTAAWAFGEILSLNTEQIKNV